MFTGLIKDIGTILSIVPMQACGKKITIQTKLAEAHFSLGCSICHHGICLTVISFSKEKEGIVYDVELSQETLSCTNAQFWQEGDYLNIEPSLKVGDELGGHFVLGHVDSVISCRDIFKTEDYWVVYFSYNNDQKDFIASKGSIALNGVSLTVNHITHDTFDICLIPHSIKNTTMQFLKQGDVVNVEFDPIARYCHRILTNKE